MPKHLAIIIAFGPEVRSFIYSGLLEKIAEQYSVTIFASRPASPVLQGLPEGVRIVPLPSENEPALLRKWRYRASVLHSLWLERRGNRQWQHYLHDGERKSLKKLVLSGLACQGSVRLISTLEDILARNLGTNAGWARLYAQLGLDAVITSSYASERTLAALQTASNLGMKTVIVTNSWKDIHVNPHVPFKPNKILVWNDSNARLFRDFNPWLRPEILAVSGSLHLGAFLNPSRILPKEVFYRQAGLNPNRPFLCYTAASPQAVMKEETVVGLLLEAISQGKLPQNPQLLLRINPMEDGSRFAALARRYPSDLILQLPRWEWFPEADWCCALPDDVKLWVSTVHYAALNVSIPSTVTLEFASLGKPVVNICFDASSDIPEAASNRRFWFADFYSEIKAMGFAIPSFFQDELIENIGGLLAASTNSNILAKNQLQDWINFKAVKMVLATLDKLIRSISIIPKTSIKQSLFLKQTR